MALKSKKGGRKAIEINFYWCRLPVYSHCLHDTFCCSQDSHILIFTAYIIYMHILHVYRVFLAVHDSSRGKSLTHSVSDIFYFSVFNDYNDYKDNIYYIDYKDYKTTKTTNHCNHYRDSDLDLDLDWGVVIYNQMVTWTAFAILAMFRRRYDVHLRVFRELCLFGADMMCFWGKRQDWKCLLLGNPPTGHGHKRALLIHPRLVHFKLQWGQNLVSDASFLTWHHWNTKNEEGGVGVIGGHSYATAQSRCRRLGKGLRRLRPFHISLHSSHPDATPLTPFFG